MLGLNTKVLALCSSLLIINVALAQVCSEEDNLPLQRLRLGLEWFVNPDHLPLIVAQRHGIFRAFGLDVELVEPADHWEAEEEILAGRLDVAVTEPLHLAQDAAKDKPVLGFSRFLHTDGGVLYDAANGSIKRPADMCGKTISYPGSPGPGGPAIVNTMVRADGKADCDLSSYGRYNGGFYHTDALLSGKADVATLVFWNFEIPEAKAKGMKEASFFSLKEWGVPDFCQLVLMTTPKRFEEMKPVLRRLVLAMRRATGLIHQQPDLARQYYHLHVDSGKADATQQTITEATFNATLPAFPNDNSMATDYYERLMHWLIETQQVDAEAGSQVPVSKYWTNEVSW
ncbi:putative NMT1/THI5 thiamine [Guillardia theta CCMP2712]|uniref:Thiamine pyrimidine synthase n=1 Tax=Guillardia theta (strain CCMP2712) TaxID=905079 RepID=L1IJ87_GUITC|nr:putative NMT1/THI5 thiamine [Guillardia theta CCMP2712]EKX35994.1 putative NMT1/THI5 thiamine [Guillardia theta CCMP2712]|mmetsp:Transcript_52481/g.162886  ORF Transcript_52481/g.162886 Transcript_52481/m.162886 type:complete len:343 (-) Transcript_52481:159-1187(-)|eukprot:XP_005822974.1 putative NMT1/THI5 thiamine [Guillardia theta CCMP2712]